MTHDSEKMRRSPKRRRVTLKESIRKAADAPGPDASGGFAPILIGIWYWISGEPVQQGQDVDDPTD